MKDMKNVRFTALLLLASLLSTLSSCAYTDRVAPIKLPETAANMVVVGNGLKITARAFINPQQAEDAFGFDIRKAGILPVQVTFQNDGTAEITVKPADTLLLDLQGNAWPILSLDKTYKRTKGYVEVGETAKGAAKPALLMGAAGAVAGLAIGIVTGNNIGETMGQGAVLGAAAGAIGGGADSYGKTGRMIKNDLAAKSLQNKAIVPGQISYGVLFFPGTPGKEAISAKELRLAISSGYKTEIVKIDLR